MFSSCLSGGLIKTAEPPSLSIGEWEIIFLGIMATSIGDIPGIIEHNQKYLIMEKRYFYHSNIQLVNIHKKPTRMVKLSFHKHHRKTGTLKVLSSSLVTVTGEVITSHALLWGKCLFSRKLK